MATSTGKKSSQADRTKRLVHVLQHSVTNWSEYAKQVSQLAADGNVNLGEWAEKYARLWQALSEDLASLTKLAFPGDEPGAKQTARPRKGTKRPRSPR